MADTPPVHWDEDGTPRSTLFDDVYRSQSAYGNGDRGWAQSRGVFLQGCGLLSDGPTPAAWAGRGHWHVLETGFGLGLNFLATWHAWQQDEQRPERLFFTSIEAWPVTAEDIVRSAQAFPALQPLARTLAAAWRGLLPGVHRLVFEGGRVQLTLCVGLVDKMLREVDAAADSVFLDGFSPAVNPQMWDRHTLKGIARLSRTGTRVASWCVKRQVRDDLTECGFQVIRAQGVAPKAQRLEAVFSPHWSPRSRTRTAQNSRPDRSALVIGAGLSGAAVACSLARRGWHVTVVDAGEGVGAGASGLPAGLTAPHVSPDDSVLSRITRAGVRATLQRCAELLEAGHDWAPSGVLEHRVEGKRALPGDPAWPPQGHEWSTTATAQQKADAGLPEGAQALWHPMAAWLRPRQLVAAQLKTPGIELRWNTPVQSLRRCACGWQAVSAQGQVLAEAAHVVVASGFHSLALLPEAALPLNPLRGQISMGALTRLSQDLQGRLPQVPVNGHGSFITGVPLPPEWGGQPGWYLGSTFERACTEPVLRSEDHAANHDRLAALLPALSEPMRPAFGPDQVMAWAGLRCTLPDRLPAIGPIAPQALPGLQVCVGMGARGISLSVLSGELIAAQLEGEPLPLSASLAAHLMASRFAAGP